MRGIAAFFSSGLTIGVVLVVTMGLLWLLYYSFPLALFIIAPIAMLLMDSVRARLKARATAADRMPMTSDQTER